MSGIEEEKGDWRKEEEEEEAIVDRDKMKEERKKEKGLKCVFVGEFVCTKKRDEKQRVLERESMKGKGRGEGEFI